MISISSWCAEIVRWVVRASASAGGKLSGTNTSTCELSENIRNLRGWDGGKAGGGDCLAVALLLFARNVEADAFGHVGKLGGQHAARGRQQHAAARASHHAAED